MKKIVAILLTAAACKSGASINRYAGQTEYLSAPLPGTSHGTVMADAAGGTSGGGTAAPQTAGATSTASSDRQVQETDIYRVDGNRLYVLNTYRGLLVFDISNPDAPVLLGRSPVFGDPQEMIVQNGIASIVVSDWFGTLDDGTPYNGSLVRSVDVTNPAQPQVLAEAKIAGFVSDLRVVGTVMYAVSVDYGFSYGFDFPGGVVGVAIPARDSGVSSTTNSSGPTVYVTSVNIAAGAATQVAQKSFTGWSGAFHVTQNAVLLAQNAESSTSQTQLTYLDISDPGGAIVERGSATINGSLATWGADAGRWNIDLDAGNIARAVTQSDTIIVSTVDFSNPDTPIAAPQFSIPNSGNGYLVAARFDSGRLYLAPDASYTGASSVVSIYAVSTLTPALEGTTAIDGTAWLFMPNGNELFVLASETTSDSGSIAVEAIDVTDPTQPKSLGDASFGSGWAWSPAASTFKAFIMDDDAKLIAIPFSGWNGTAYNNGVELVSYAGNPVVADGTAQIHGWVERGIFAAGRLFALSDLSLAVVDYSTPTAPRVVTELTLARNITALQPLGANIAELDEDWFGYDDHAELRILSAANPDDPTSAAPSLMLDGSNARLFANGSLAYVVTDVASASTQRIQVIDLSSGTPQKRGQIDLPPVTNDYGYSWGWGPWDWYSGADAVQVGGDLLALRRWESGQTPLYVIDLHDPDHPGIASVSVLNADNEWWGNMVVVGGRLYVTHDEWYSSPFMPNGYVRYYADQIDLTNRAAPSVGAKINMPGVLVGGSDQDASILYTVDYRWNAQTSESWLNAVRLAGTSAVYQGGVDLSGYSGRVIVSGTDVYTSVDNWQNQADSVALHDVSFADPQHPKDNPAVAKSGWGWLLDVQGDRAIIQSGWSGSGFDLYQLHPGGAPTYDQFVRTSGWWETALARQGQSLFFASGDYGVQTVTLP